MTARISGWNACGSSWSITPLTYSKTSSAYAMSVERPRSLAVKAPAPVRRELVVVVARVEGLPGGADARVLGVFLGRVRSGLRRVVFVVTREGEEAADLLARDVELHQCGFAHPVVRVAGVERRLGLVAREVDVERVGVVCPLAPHRFRFSSMRSSRDREIEQRVLTEEAAVLLDLRPLDLFPVPERLVERVHEGHGGARLRRLHRDDEEVDPAATLARLFDREDRGRVGRQEALQVGVDVDLGAAPGEDRRDKGDARERERVAGHREGDPGANQRRHAGAGRERGACLIPDASRPKVFDAFSERVAAPPLRIRSGAPTEHRCPSRPQRSGSSCSTQARPGS